VTESLFAPAADVRYTAAQLIGRPLEKSIDPHDSHSWGILISDHPPRIAVINARQPTVPVDGVVGAQSEVAADYIASLNRRASSESIDGR